MSGKAAPLFTIESSFPRADSTLRFLEPADSCRDALWQRLFAGTYDKPFILDSGPYRTLHFDLDAVQSAMCLADPDTLSLAYTRKMMAFLLFNHAPARILLLGLGGGSLAKFCYRGLPRAAVTAVEINRDVIELREEFCIPRDDERFRVICAEGAHYVAHLKRPKDVILADACDRTGHRARAGQHRILPTGPTPLINWRRVREQPMWRSQRLRNPLEQDPRGHLTTTSRSCRSRWTAMSLCWRSRIVVRNSTGKTSRREA